MLCAPCVAAVAPPLAIPMLIITVLMAIVKLGVKVIPNYILPLILLFFLVRFTQ